MQGVLRKARDRRQPADRASVWEHNHRSPWSPPQLSRSASRSAHMRFLAAFLLLAMTTPAPGQDLPLPRARPPTETSEPVPLPRQRPAVVDTDPVPEVLGPPAPLVYQAACPGVLAGLVDAQMLPPLTDGRCGERSPLAVTGLLVNGRMVPLSGEAVLTCAMGSALPDWAAAVDGYLVARENTRIARIIAGTSYACRNRNNMTEGSLSEHGLANALDIVGFELEDGRTMTLLGGWSVPEAPAGRLLRFAHDAACARFTTTLGPEANAEHADHFHLDLGCHGAQCTSRVCE